MNPRVALAGNHPATWRRVRPARSLAPGYWLVGVVGSALLGVSAALQAMLAAFLFVPGRIDPAVLDQLTQRGRAFFYPELDLAFYLAGCLAAVALTLGLTWRWSRRFDRLADHARAAYALASGGRQVTLALITNLVSLAVLGVNEPRPALRAVGLAGPGVCALVVAWFRLAKGPGPWSRALAGWLARRDAPTLASVPARRTSGLSGLALTLGIASMVLVPSCPRLAGSFVFLENVPFHHWDFFVMAPALGYLHGGALGTGIYSQYGVAWPVIYSWLAPVVPLTYGNVLTVSVLVGTLYFVGLGLILRQALGSTAWATVGTVLAILGQMHLGVIPEMTIWLTPSSSILRSPVDILFFFALWKHGRTGRSGWLTIAGAVAGFGLLFETDTGLYLVATLAFTLACLVARPIVPWPSGRRFASVASCAGALVAITIVGLTIASRGTILHRAFWAGWLEPLRVYSGGFSALPFSTADGLAGPIVFLAIAGTYLTVLGTLLASLARGARVTPKFLLAGALSSHGLCLLLQFVNRSHVFNLYHACVPFCVLGTAFAAEGSGMLARLGPVGKRARSLAPRVALVLALAALVATPSFRAYPSVWARLLGGKPARGLTLMPGVEGLPLERSEYVADFRAATARLRALRAEGKTVGVLDPAETLLALAAGVPPLDRYGDLMTRIIRKDELAAAQRRLAEGRRDVLVIRGADCPESNWGDTRDALLSVVARHYDFAEAVGSYGLWRRRE